MKKRVFLCTLAILMLLSCSVSAAPFETQNTMDMERRAEAFSQEEAFGEFTTRDGGAIVPFASEDYSYTSAKTTSASRGKLTIIGDMQVNYKSTKLGIEEIRILKDLGGGRFTLVNTYGPYDATNRAEYYKELTISAESGQGYKASIKFYVTNANGEKVFKTATSNVFIVK